MKKTEYTYDFWTLIMRRVSEINQSEKEYIRSYYSETKNDIFKIGCERKVIPFLAKTLIELDIDVEFWSNHYLFYKKRNLSIVSLLDRLFQDFSNNGILSPCLTENFAALLVSNNDVACFCSGDVDISADINERNQIIECMIKHGFKIVKRKKYRNEIKQDELICPPEKIKNFYINLVWKPVIRERDYSINQKKVEAWLKNERANSFRYSNTQIKLLSLESTLIHCIYHMSVGHYYCASPGIRLFTEIDWLLNDKTLNIDKLNDISVSLSIAKRVYTSIELVELFLCPLKRIEQRIALSRKEKKQCESIIRSLTIRRKKSNIQLKEPTSSFARLVIDSKSDQGPFIKCFFGKIVAFLTHSIHKS